VIMSEQDPSNPDYQTGHPSVREMHDSAYCENPDPVVGRGGRWFVPLLVTAGLIVLVAARYYASHHNGVDFSDSIAYPGYVAAARPGGAAGSGDGVGEATERKPWIEEWMDEGKKTYTNCIACHQANGAGLPGVFPPLKGSEWVNGGTERLAMIVLDGVTGPMTVAGVKYDNPAMQPWKALPDKKLAQVLTYVRREFGELPEGKSGVVTTEMIQAARGKYGSRATQWTEAELQAVPADAELPGVEVDLNTGEPSGGGQ